MPRQSQFFALCHALALAVALLPAQAPAGQEQLRFDVLFRGLPVARIALTARDDGAVYAVAGRVETTGIAAAFRRVRFGMQAEGRWRGARPRPRRYAEDVDTGRRRSTVEMRFDGGRPRIVRQAPSPGPAAVAPRDAAGHADPLSALWRLVRGGARDTLCDFALPVYDGARQSELAVAASETTSSVHCRGRYTRLAGFPADAMAERPTFPFSAVYAERGGQYVLTEVEAMSLLGPIRIVRRD
jgi:hypothetical protein